MNIGDTIKIGRREHTIIEGDYIMYNGACYMFCTSDRRTLFRTKNGRFSNYHSYETLPNKLVKVLRKEIPGIYELGEKYDNRPNKTVCPIYVFKAKAI